MSSKYRPAVGQDSGWAAGWRPGPGRQAGKDMQIYSAFHFCMGGSGQRDGSPGRGVGGHIRKGLGGHFLWVNTPGWKGDTMREHSFLPGRAEEKQSPVWKPQFSQMTSTPKSGRNQDTPLWGL